MKRYCFKIVYLVILLPVFTFSQIVNTGILKIDESTTVSFVNAYTNSGDHHNDGDLFINNDFTNIGNTFEFKAGSTTVLSTGTTNFESSTDSLNIYGTPGKIYFHNISLNVTSGSGVLVDDGLGLMVSNMVNLFNGDLRLEGEAQLIQTHPGSNINTANSGSLLRDQQGITSLYAYNYWSSPVSNNAGSFTLNGGLFDGTDALNNPFIPQQVGFNTGSPYNGVPATVDVSGNVTSPLQISDRWLYTYSPNTTGYSGWDKIVQNDGLSPGLGFTMKGTGVTSQNYVFKGLPNDGDYSFSINSGETILVGNPYPSALDSHSLIDDNISIFETIQIWVDGGSTSHYLATYLGGYAILNKSGSILPVLPSGISGLGSTSGLNPERYIAVGQGFFVEALNDGDITFANSQRVFMTEAGGNSIFYKGSNEKTNSATNSEEEVRRIWIGYEDPGLTHRQLLLGFLPNCNADLGYNVGYDALMRDAREDELYFLIENDPTKKYLIQGVGAFDNSYEFPIGITITNQGNHTVMIDNVENFNDTVYIKDAVLNTCYNLSESNFSPNLPPGEYLDRFYLVFQSQTLNTTTTDIFNDNDIYIYFKEEKIIINNNNQIDISNISVYDMLGQEPIKVNLNNSKDKRVSIPFNQQKGMYLVLLESGPNKKTFKIIN